MFSLLFPKINLILLTVLFSRTHFKANSKERWGCSPQTPTRVLSIRSLNRRNSPSCRDCSLRLISARTEHPPQAAVRASSLDPQLANSHSWNKRTNSACCAEVTKSLRASGPRKPGKSEGESELSPADYSLAFPGCKASGLAASPPGQKHNGIKSNFRVLFLFHREQS